MSKTLTISTIKKFENSLRNDLNSILQNINKRKIPHLKRFLLIFKNKQRSAAYSLFVLIHDVTVCPMRCLKAMPKVL